jgi:hypothetical protein
MRLPAAAGSLLGGEFSTGEMGNFHPALTRLRFLTSAWQFCEDDDCDDHLKLQGVLLGESEAPF